MAIVIPALALVFLSLFFSAVFKRKLSEGFPLSAFFVIIVMYIFSVTGIKNAINMGYGAVMVLSVAALVGFVYIAIKQKVDYKQLHIPSTLVIFFAFLALFIFINYGRVFSSWDEFTHWGTTYKSMILEGVLGSNTQSYTWFKHYPPALAIFQHFFARASSVYREDLALIGHNVLYLCMIIPFINYNGKKTFLATVLSAFMFLCVPLICTPLFYTLTLIDTILGITFAFVIAMHFAYEKSVYKILLSCTSIATLVLLKESGLFLAIIAVAIIFVDEFYTRKINGAEKIPFKLKNIKQGISTYKYPLLGVATIFVASVSWKINLALNGVVTSDLSFSEKISEYITKLSRPDLMQILMKVANNLTQQNAFTNSDVAVSQFGITLTVLTFVLVYCVSMCFFGKLVLSEQFKKRFFAMQTILISGFVAYIFGIICIYIFKFSVTESLAAASFFRYLSTYVIAILFLVVAFSVIKGQKCDDTAALPKLLVVILVVFCLATNIVLHSILVVVDSPNTKVDAVKLRDSISLSTKLIEENLDDESVLFVSQGDTSIETLAAWYNIFPNHNIKNLGNSSFLPKMTDEMAGVTWVQAISADDWADMVLDSYQYVCIHKTDSTFNREYGKFFEGDVLEKALYRVTVEDSVLKLILVEQAVK